ncbi:MAG: DUF885 domain-containing protein [Lewinella sp.]|nr:DUF885 domain-containing protein [Lewinella sp.]
MKKHLLFLILLLAMTACTSPDRTAEPTDTEALTVFIDDFNPAASGRRQASAEDLSAESFAAELQHTRDQLTRLRAIDTSQLTGDDLIDWKFAESILVGQELRQARMQAWKKDPRQYMSFSGLSRVIGRPGDYAEKVEELRQRLRIMPVQLANGQAQLEVYVPRFQELSLFMAENGRTFFEQELAPFIAATGASDLQAPADSARAALETFITFLQEELPKRPEGHFAIGEDTYNAMLAGQLLLPFDADSLYTYGWQQFEKTVAELEALAATIDPTKSWQELCLEIKNDYPEPHQMIEAHQEWVNKARDHILANDLIPIPWPERVAVVPRAEYLRKTSYYGNFSRARELDEDSVYTAQWMINPYEDQWDEATKQDYLTEHDWGVIIVTAPHESYGGHHVQGLYQLHNPRPLRRDNGLSLFSEGWGLYNEQLMQETGFFPGERIHLRQLQLRLWRNARVVYDVGLHTGRLTYDEAVRLMTERVGFLEWAGQLEIDSATSSPGYFIGYFLGMAEILRMRDDYRAIKGETFTLRDFHEDLLKIGNMPTTLMREALLQ